MKIRLIEILNYLISILLFIIISYFLINNIMKKQIEIINFIDSEIHENFEVEITNNLEDINNYLKKFLFIESYLLKRLNNEINIYINLKK